MCRTDDDHFTEPADLLPPDQDKPDFAANILQSGLADVRALVQDRLLRGVGPGLLDQAAGVLPRLVRDHVPKSYFRSLSIEV